MKKVLSVFANEVLSKGEMKKVKGGGGCSDNYFNCVDSCQGQTGDAYVYCLMDCWAEFSHNCNEY